MEVHYDLASVGCTLISCHWSCNKPRPPPLILLKHILKPTSREGRDQLAVCCRLSVDLTAFNTKTPETVPKESSSNSSKEC